MSSSYPVLRIIVAIASCLGACVEQPRPESGPRGATECLAKSLKPCDLLLDALVSYVRSSRGGFGSYAKSLFSGSLPRVSGRTGGALPLPPVTAGDLACGVRYTDAERGALSNGLALM